MYVKYGNHSFDYVFTLIAWSYPGNQNTSSYNTHLIKGPHWIDLRFDLSLSVELHDGFKSWGYQLWMIDELTKMISTNCTILVYYRQRIETFGCKVILQQIPVAFVFTGAEVSCTYKEQCIYSYNRWPHLLLPGLSVRYFHGCTVVNSRLASQPCRALL